MDNHFQKLKLDINKLTNDPTETTLQHITKLHNGVDNYFMTVNGIIAGLAGIIGIYGGLKINRYLKDKK